MVWNGTISCNSSRGYINSGRVFPLQRVLVNFFHNLTDFTWLFHRLVEQDFVLLLQFLEFRQEHILHLLHLLGQLVLHGLHLGELLLRAPLVTRTCCFLILLSLLLKVALSLDLFRFLMDELPLVLIMLLLVICEVLSDGICCLVCLLF